MQRIDCAPTACDEDQKVPEQSIVRVTRYYLK